MLPSPTNLLCSESIAPSPFSSATIVHRSPSQEVLTPDPGPSLPSIWDPGILHPKALGLSALLSLLPHLAQPSLDAEDAFPFCQPSSPLASRTNSHGCLWLCPDALDALRCSTSSTHQLPLIAPVACLLSSTSKTIVPACFPVSVVENVSVLQTQATGGKDPFIYSRAGLCWVLSQAVTYELSQQAHSWLWMLFVKAEAVLMGLWAASIQSASPQVQNSRPCPDPISLSVNTHHQPILLQAQRY